jgi:hypothetical protein
MSNLARYDRELLANPELVEYIMRELPPVTEEPERVIRCSAQNVERAVCRALARAVAWGECWRVELVG